jgi:pimeloyl-ACP methyl ester carboxylesterase
VLLNALAILLLSAPVPTPEDTLLDVGGYRMHLVLHRGTSPLTIVMESGGGASLDNWFGLDSTLARGTGATVVAYDRAGFGRSETGPADLTPEQQVRQLNLALQRLGTPPSRVVIGYSYGGLLAVMHGHLYADQVRGLVLVDPMNVRFVRATGDFVHTTVPHIEHPATAKDSATARMISGFDRLVANPTAADTGLDLPIVVITAGEPWWGKPEIDGEWRAAHQAIAKAKPGRRLIVAERSRHLVPRDRPDTILEAVASLTGDPAAGR